MNICMMILGLHFCPCCQYHCVCCPTCTKAVQMLTAEGHPAFDPDPSSEASKLVGCTCPHVHHLPSRVALQQHTAGSRYMHKSEDAVVPLDVG